MMPPAAPEQWSPPTRRRLWLMRHGEVDYFDAEGRPVRVETVALSDTGRAQADAAARALAEVPFDRAITSGLDRSVQTAERVLAGRDVPLDHDPRVREIENGRLDAWAGASHERVRAAILDALAPTLAPEDRFLAGESFASLVARAEEWWDATLARRDWTELLVVSHAVFNRLLLARCLGAGLGALGALEQDAGCINLLEVADGKALVRLVNWTPLTPAKEGLRHSTLEGLYLQYLRGRSG